MFRHQSTSSPYGSAMMKPSPTACATTGVS
jgi:hypothetical protein